MSVLLSLYKIVLKLLKTILKLLMTTRWGMAKLTTNQSVSCPVVVYQAWLKCVKHLESYYKTF